MMMMMMILIARARLLRKVWFWNLKNIFILFFEKIRKKWQKGEARERVIRNGEKERERKYFKL